MPVLAGDELPDPEILAAERSPIDDKPANGSSIAFLVEYDSRQLLLAADASPEQLAESLAELGHGPDNPIKLDAYKVSHHGSRRNTTAALMKCMRSRRFLVSTNGVQTKHPDLEAIARLITSNSAPCELFFNYRTNFTSVWDRDDWRSKYGYRTIYGDGDRPMLIEIPPPTSECP
jgi:hypothetical protein